MGCYDTVNFNCPKCGSREEVQSKSGDCTLSVYNWQRVPVDVAQALTYKLVHCENCGIEIAFDVPAPSKVKVMPFIVSQEEA